MAWMLHIIPSQSGSMKSYVKCTDYPSRYHHVETGAELVKMLNDEQFDAADCTQVFLSPMYVVSKMLTHEKVVELILGKDDAPLSVKMASAAVEAFNSRQ